MNNNSPQPAESFLPQTDNALGAGSQVKYSPLEDKNFWLALALGNVPLALSYIVGGIPLLFTLGLNVIFLATWVGWVIYKKGRKNSLFIGLIISSLFLMLIIFALNSITAYPRQMTVYYDYSGLEDEGIRYNKCLGKTDDTGSICYGVRMGKTCFKTYLYAPSGKYAGSIQPELSIESISIPCPPGASFPLSLLFYLYLNIKSLINYIFFS